MGLEARDFDGDGDLDVIVTHLEGETNTVYRNDGGGFFMDATTPTRLSMASLRNVGFGILFVDYDNDGWLDLFIANGHIIEAIERIRPGSGSSHAQANQLLHNDGRGGFTDVSAESGPHFANRRVSRGAAYGDIDNDGDADILIANNDDEAVLLLNQLGQESAWIGFELVGSRSNRDAFGARVDLVADGRRRSLELRSASSYLSQNDKRLLFGLGDGSPVESVEVRWPAGRRLSLDPSAIPAGAYHRIVEPAD
jgi:hypothetical protein